MRRAQAEQADPALLRPLRLRWCDTSIADLFRSGCSAVLGQLRVDLRRRGKRQTHSLANASASRSRTGRRLGAFATPLFVFMTRMARWSPRFRLQDRRRLQDYDRYLRGGHYQTQTLPEFLGSKHEDAADRVSTLTWLLAWSIAAAAEPAARSRSPPPVPACSITWTPAAGAAWRWPASMSPWPGGQPQRFPALLPGHQDLADAAFREYPLARRMFEPGVRRWRGRFLLIWEDEPRQCRHRRGRRPGAATRLAPAAQGAWSTMANSAPSPPGAHRRVAAPDLRRRWSSTATACAPVRPHPPTPRRQGRPAFPDPGGAGRAREKPAARLGRSPPRPYRDFFQPQRDRNRLSHRWVSATRPAGRRRPRPRTGAMRPVCAFGDRVAAPGWTSATFSPATTSTPP